MIVFNKIRETYAIAETSLQIHATRHICSHVFNTLVEPVGSININTAVRRYLFEEPI